MIGNPLLLGPEGYQISRSVRLRSSASGNFSKTYGATGNQQLWTWSCWVKRGKLSDSTGGQTFFSGLNGLSAGNSRCRLTFESDDTLNLALTNMNTAEVAGYRTAAVFRDPSAWYHVVVAIETANATAGDRVKLYVNGTRYTTSGTTAALNANMPFGVNAVPTYIGSYYNPSSGTAYFDGYLTEINFIDGQALTPSSFGETDAITGVWKPKKYAGTYGTNGFFLNFSDNSSNTATTIGKDYSGNGNNWTPNNISVTAGATYDSTLDVPTLWADGGNGRGNYCVLSPIMPGVATGGGAVAGVKDGNLLGGNTGSGGWAIVGSTMAIPSGGGKFYFECTVGASGQSMSVGVQKADSRFTAQYIVGNTGDSNGYSYCNDGLKYNNGGTSYGSTAAAGDVIGVAVDASGGTSSITFYKNNVSLGTAFTGITGDLLPAMSSVSGSGMCPTNFGQRPFTYTPPTGFKALNTQNLPEPTIKKGNQYFDISTWTGDQSARTITNSGGMQPDFLWTKSRSAAEDHRLSDAVRGGNGTVLGTLASNTMGAEAFDTDVTGFTSSGFNIRAGTNSPNVTGRTYVGWQWKEGATQGFDIVTYTGTGVARTVAHSLGVAPSMMIVKNRSISDTWGVYHRALDATPQNFRLNLNTTDAKLTAPNSWANTAPTSSVFTVGTDAMVNGNGNSLVAYLFAEVAGFSKFGSYTGNGSNDGPFVYCGFRPRWVMVKKTSSTGSWAILDSARDPFNQGNKSLYPDLSNAEVTIYDFRDFLANGFKIRTTDQNSNGNGDTYVYAAFAENPFRNSLAR